ncbi:MAG: deoxyribonuclease HsdR [Flavobacteriales bacterium]|nr:deoxyribonuclease HsdR [Flavobacteriales bacterium]MBO73251.1 deoxyribonuclease HsdR [Flavobacteriales bacterium]|tara:strand:+ start:642 stop:2087 length:1446 start_codon:yes stop_codon:yes gene_type:complete
MKKFSHNIITASLGAAIALGGFHLINNLEKEETTKKPIVVSEQPKIQLSKASVSSAKAMPTFESAAEQTVNSVVHIKTIATQQGSHQQYDPFQEFFFGRPQNLPKHEVSGSGSGVIISEDGYIATNNHVVEGATKIEVTLNDKKTYNGTIIGTDPTTDLALIKIEEKNLPAIYYGNSDDVNIGEWVLAVGNPFNLTSTVTAGIVSAKGRNINILKEDYAIESFIQTDAAVNPGNSGGALVNQNGELIGINTAIASNTGSYTGYSFAVPVNMVKKIMGDLAKHGTVQRALLGVQIREINQDLAEKNDISNLEGIYISKVMNESSAEDGGLQEGDIIRSLNGVKVKSPSELQEKIGQYRPGDVVNVEYERDGETKNASLTLKNKLGTTESIAKEILFLGAKIGKVSSKEKKNLGINGGVKIDEIKNGKLLQQGVKKGFIITKVNHKEIKSPDQLIATLKSLKGGVLIEGIYPSGAKAYYGFGI